MTSTIPGWDDKLARARQLARDALLGMLRAQRADGGFSPYPSVIEPLGTLGTADALLALVNEHLEYTPLYVEFLNTEVVGYWKQSRSVRERILAAIDLLIDIRSVRFEDGQIPHEHGGYPPIGDVFYLREACFTDATADAILALLAAWSFLRAEAPHSADPARSQNEKVRPQRIQSRVKEAIEYLAKEARGEGTVGQHSKVCWTNSEYHSDLPGHVFCTWLAVLALDVYLGRVQESKFPLPDRIETVELERLRDGGIVWLAEIFAGQAFEHMPFNAGSKDRVSVTNTAATLRILKKSPSLVESTLKMEPDDFARKGKEWLDERIKEASATETDEIDLEPIQRHAPWILTRYEATYATRQAVLRAYLDFFGKDVKSEAAFAAALDGLLAELSENNGYCLEERIGIPQPATSATATAVMFLKALLAAFGKKIF
jgi:hypothetical protein